MLVIDSLIVGGIRFVLDKIATAVNEELNDEGNVRERLLEAQMRLELGEITDEEFAAVEADVLAAVRRIREQRGEAAGPIEFGKSGDTEYVVTGVEASFGGDDDGEPSK